MGKLYDLRNARASRSRDPAADSSVCRRSGTDTRLGHPAALTPQRELHNRGSAESGRPLRVSSAYDWHRAHGAAFGEKSGWERVNWYEANEAAGDESLRPRGWAGMHWSPAIGAEHRATREAAGLFDRYPFGKLMLPDPQHDWPAALRNICAAVRP